MNESIAIAVVCILCGLMVLGIIGYLMEIMILRGALKRMEEEDKENVGVNEEPKEIDDRIQHSFQEAKKYFEEKKRYGPDEFPHVF